MIGTGNNEINNIINRRPAQYQDINNLESMGVLKPKLYKNMYNLNMNNPSGNNSMNKQNIRINRNMNMNNMNNMKILNNIKNNMNNNN